jgi:propionyl-CoA carboxylase alpha chain
VSFDPMLAKVVAHAPTRSEAAGRLALALERLHLGGLTTNRDFLAAVLRHPAFLDGDTTTDFIDRVQPATHLALDDGELHRVAAAAALWLQGRNRAEVTVLPNVPSGWRNARLPDQWVQLGHRGGHVDVRYRSRRDGSFHVRDLGEARIHRWSPDGIDVELAGRRSVHAVTAAGDQLHVQTVRGTVDLEVVPRFVPPGGAGADAGFVAPMPGVVLEVRCAAGDHVTTGQTLVVLEAMKMEHHMNAPADGVVAEVRVKAGEQVENGAVLLVFDAHAEESDG